MRTEFSRILIAFSIGIACVTLSSATFGGERSGPLHVPLQGEWQPYFETLGPLELFKVRQIEGSLEVRRFVVTDGKHADKDTPLGKVVLTLRNALSGGIVRSSTTDDQGRFNLSDVKPGSYVLQMMQGGEPTRSPKIQGSFLIELRTDAKELPRLALSMSDCGMDVHEKSDKAPLNQQSESTHAQTN